MHQIRSTALRSLAAAAAFALAAPLHAQQDTAPQPSTDSVAQVPAGPTAADVPAEATRLRPGMRVRLLIPEVTNYRRAGTLQAATADSVVIARIDGGRMGVALTQLDGIEGSLGRGRVRSTAVGFGVGAFVGSAGFYLAGIRRPSAERSPREMLKAQNVLTGAAIGAAIGAITGSERWKRIARMSPAELDRSTARAGYPAPSTSRFTIAPVVGVMGGRDFDAVANISIPGDRVQLPIRHQIDRTTAVGGNVEFVGGKWWGALAGATYTLGSNSGVDSVQLVTSGHHVLFAKVAPALRIPTPIAVQVYAGPLFMRETPMDGAVPADWFSQPHNHWGLSLGATGDVPLPTRRVTLRLSAEDNMVKWDANELEQRLRVRYPASDFRIAGVDATHLVTLSAGLAFHI
jgi:hypothetical protein